LESSLQSSDTESDAGLAELSDSTHDNGMPQGIRPPRAIHARRITRIDNAAPPGALNLRTPPIVPPTHRTLLAARRSDRAVRAVDAILGEFEGSI
jgi:hypothetical protein